MAQASDEDSPHGAAPPLVPGDRVTLQAIVRLVCERNREAYVQVIAEKGYRGHQQFWVGVEDIERAG
jgi:hypothetical protein